jgi:hypothetical protein
MHLCRINSCAPGWKGLPMPKYIASRAPARNRTSADLLCPNFRLNDRTRSALIARCHGYAGAHYSTAVAALEGPPERLHVRDAASITTSAGVEVYHVG